MFVFIDYTSIHEGLKDHVFMTFLAWRIDVDGELIENIENSKKVPIRSTIIVP